VEPTFSNVRGILQKPAYAGAYTFGRVRVDPTRQQPGVSHSGKVRQPIDRWEVCIQDAFPAYLSWEEFVTNQKRLAANQNNYPQKKPGVVRKGRALLQGIALCGVCGGHLRLRYAGRQADLPIYVCDTEMRQYRGPQCQQVRALEVDAEIERLALAALEPDRVALAIGALEQLEIEASALERQWEMKIERARYEATRAQRQYDTCEPENRLVARNLEPLWEAKLRAVEEAEKEFETWRKQHHTALTAEDRQQIVALGENLPMLWAAPTTTNVDRKQIIRLIIKDVILDQKRERGKVWFKINWRTGATTEHWIKRRTGSYREQADVESLQRRIEELNGSGKHDAEIAAILKAEGYRTTRGGEISHAGVCRLRRRWGVRANRAYEAGYNPQRWDDGTFSVQGAALAIGVAESAVHVWLRRGLLKGKQSVKGAPWKITLTEEDISGLREYAEQSRPAWRR
jgi:hypothetical protein